MRCVHLGMMGVLMFVAGFASMAVAVELPAEFAGSDGAYSPSDDDRIVLNAAAVGPWNLTSGAGKGVYDRDQWAVIFRFTEVNIPEDVTVTFQNNASRAPVIWLVEGDVTINGVLDLSGSSGEGIETYGVAETAGGPGSMFTEPGPGGFRGGRGPVSGSTPSPGLGLGGGKCIDYLSGENGSYGGGFAEGTWVYGNAGCFPLIGGSGGAGWKEGSRKRSGGAGGGAILIAATGTITIGPKGKLLANGGDGTYHIGGDSAAGSGGMIRLVANTITGNGLIQAAGGTATYHRGLGYDGRIRIEANTDAFSGQIWPSVTADFVPSPLRLFRDDTTPRITPRLLGGKPIAEDPRANMSGLADVNVLDLGMTLLEVEAQNVPPNMQVSVRVARRDGGVDSSSLEEIPLAMTKTDGVNSTWQGEVDVVSGISAMQVHARFVD